MASAMRPFDSARRDLLKLSSVSLAASAAAALPAFAAAPRKGAALPTTPSLFDVRAYGATGDGKTVDSPAINKAIEAAAAAGGGTVIFPAGNYVSFSIRLKSHVDLYLSQGCTIIAAESPLPGQTTGYMGGTYDAAEPNSAWEAYQDWGHNHWRNSLLWGDGISDFSITGPGLLWGKGLSFGADRPARGNYPKYVAEQAGVGNKVIGLKNCHNVILRDFSILKGGHFGILFTGVDNLTIDNLKIDTDRDGMDIDCCRNVRVTNCFVNAPWDDGICPKSSFALGYARPTEKVNIANCYVSGCWQLGTLLDGTYKRQQTGGGRIKCGTESNGGFINIAISNCVFEGTQGLALETVDGALLEDITVSNITMRDITSAPSSCVSARACAAPPTRPRSARCAASSSPTSTATTPPRASAPSSAASPATSSRTSSWTTSTCRTPAAARPNRSTRVPPRTKPNTPSPACSASLPRMASTCATSTASR
jgi:polygalacturonase